jgi:hypothetical protein
MLLPLAGGRGAVIKLGELVRYWNCTGKENPVSAIARQLVIDRKTVRIHMAKGSMPPTYTPRPPREHLTFTPYLRERSAAFPALLGGAPHDEV